MIGKGRDNFNKCIRSIKVLSFIEGDELVQANDSLSFGVALSNHFFDFSGCDFFIELLSSCHKVFLRYESFVILIKVLENPFDIFLSVAVAGSLGH